MSHCDSAMSAEAALERLERGNQNFVAGGPCMGDISAARLRETAEGGQHPFAVVLTCSDSRTPPEHIFSAGIGDLFVLRTVGNVVTDIELGGVEYGVEHLGARLVLVLGHSGCGAIGAALAGEGGGHINDILAEIKPALCGITDTAEAEKANLLNSVKKIAADPALAELVAAGQVQVRGAKYDIRSGVVDFY